MSEELENNPTNPQKTTNLFKELKKIKISNLPPDFSTNFRGQSTEKNSETEILILWRKLNAKQQAQVLYFISNLIQQP